MPTILVQPFGGFPMGVEGIKSSYRRSTNEHSRHHRSTSEVPDIFPHDRDTFHGRRNQLLHEDIYSSETSEVEEAAAPRPSRASSPTSTPNTLADKKNSMLHAALTLANSNTTISTTTNIRKSSLTQALCTVITQAVTKDNLDPVETKVMIDGVKEWLEVFEVGLEAWRLNSGERCEGCFGTLRVA